MDSNLNEFDWETSSRRVKVDIIFLDCDAVTNRHLIFLKSSQLRILGVKRIIRILLY